MRETTLNKLIAIVKNAVINNDTEQHKFLADFFTRQHKYNGELDQMIKALEDTRLCGPNEACNNCNTN